MPRLPRVTGGDALQAIQRDGWGIVRRRGSHVQLRHGTKPGRVTVSIHSGQLLAPKTIQRIIADAGMTVDQFIDLL